MSAGRPDIVSRLIEIRLFSEYSGRVSCYPRIPWRSEYSLDWDEHVWHILHSPCVRPGACFELRASKKREGLGTYNSSDVQENNDISVVQSSLTFNFFSVDLTAGNLFSKTSLALILIHKVGSMLLNSDSCIVAKAARPKYECKISV